MLEDRDARIAAVDPEVSCLVQAPAGSGKTQLLVTRILMLLAYRADQPENVMAMTFTRKAAQEMRVRVIEVLKMAQHPPPQESYKLQLFQLAERVLHKDKICGWDLLKNPQRLQIMTIDAFCMYLTRQLPLSSKLGVNPEPLDEPRFFYKKAAENVILRLLEESDTNIRIFLSYLDHHQELAVERIADLLACREQWMPILMNDSSDKDVLSKNLEDFLQAHFSNALEQLRNINLAKIFLYVEFALENQEDKEKLVQLATIKKCNFNQLSIDNRQAWKRLAEWLLTETGELRKTVDKRLGFPSPAQIKDKSLAMHAKAMKDNFLILLEYLREIKTFETALNDIRNMPESYHDTDEPEMIQAIFSILPQCVAELYILFAEHEKTDFSAISQCAISALGGEDELTDINMKLDYRINHLLIDEFQDTSIQQFNLISKWISAWGAYTDKTLFLVGDPMQSIYRFRQAEVGLFMRVKDHGIGDLKLKFLKLVSNFRTDSKIVNHINAILNKVFPEKEDVNLGAVPYSDSISYQYFENAGVYLESKNLSDEAELVRFMRLLNENAGLNSIAILARARSHIYLWAQILKKYGIPYQAVDIEKISNQNVVRQLMHLTRAYLHVGDLQAWVSILLSPLFNLSLVDLTHLHESGKTYFQAVLDYQKNKLLSAYAISVLEKAVPTLMAVWLQKGIRTVREGVEGLWIALQGPAISGEDSWKDAQLFFDLLSENEVAGDLDLQIFESKIENLYAKSSTNAKIQLMTIHKAKGLEFDAVIIPGMERSAAHSTRPLFVWESLPLPRDTWVFAPSPRGKIKKDSVYEFIWRKHKLRLEHESVRLLYVAMTRARKQLYLIQEGEMGAGSFLSKIKPFCDNILLTFAKDLQIES